jgi:acyl-CoA thioesterase
MSLMMETSPRRIVEKMYEKDAYSKWLGIKIVSVSTGAVVLKMKVRQEMTNGFGICHGGITYAFADSALAFACNTHGYLTVLLDASMSYPAPAKVGDILIAEANEQALSHKVGVYQVIVRKENGEKVGIFKATVYRTQKKLDE